MDPAVATGFFPSAFFEMGFSAGSAGSAFFFDLVFTIVGELRMHGGGRAVRNAAVLRWSEIAGYGDACPRTRAVNGRRACRVLTYFYFNQQLRCRPEAGAAPRRGNTAMSWGWQ